jgi:hypothetical protein
MAKQFADVSCKYGAPMGRQQWCESPDAKVHLFRVRFVDWDYDDGGAYWGGFSSPPLYCARDEDGGVQLFRRAENREDAKAQLRVVHPSLRFYR